MHNFSWNRPDRRSFLGMAAAAGALGWAAPAAADEYDPDVEYTKLLPALREDYVLDEKFTGKELDFLVDSLKILYMRFFEYYGELSGDKRRQRWWVDEDYWRGLDEAVRAPIRYRDLVGNQHVRMVYAIFYAGKYKFPRIEIGAYYSGKGEQDENVLARAPTGTVDPFKTPPGHFTLRINRYFLLNPSQAHLSDKAFWASVIYHEMLHNLGHKHSDLSDTQYRYYQMIQLEYLLRSKGAYQPGDTYVPTRCGRG
jgi:hypothetical protein